MLNSLSILQQLAVKVRMDKVSLISSTALNSI